MAEPEPAELAEATEPAATREPPYPAWLHRLVEAAGQVQGEQLSPFLPPDEGGRAAAVLILFGEGPDGPDVLLIERAATLNSHAGQPAFPGGGADPGDDGLAGTALREAAEEVGVDPAGVRVLVALPALYIPISGYDVTPVLAWWHTPVAVTPLDPGEVAAVERVPISELVDPANRFRVSHPLGYVGPAFTVRGMLVWGFTGGLLDKVFELAGWARPWDVTDVRPLPPDAFKRPPGKVDR
ncbi:MAG TPA: CoA pyrophosphatase [Mycobacteriales bacterium]|nr:CoA pyrophosphatase [Mycobacteriales bacterium]